MNKKNSRDLVGYGNKGKKVSWNFKYKVNGSVAQKKIWSELKKIPYGKTRSYGYIAKKLNTSPRYVGKVCGQNKHLIVIPCHRVIGSNQSLTGFSGGLDNKAFLLRHEGAKIANGIVLNNRNQPA